MATARQQRWMVVVYVLTTCVCGIGWMKSSAELSTAQTILAGRNKSAFEDHMATRSGDCSNMFSVPVHCSGRMSTAGQPDVPVRYTCDADLCGLDR